MAGFLLRKAENGVLGSKCGNFLENFLKESGLKAHRDNN